MAVYRTQDSMPFDIDPDVRRHGNQVILSGTDQSIEMKKGFFMLELLVVPTGETVILTDGNGREIASGVTGFSQEHSPLKCEKGLVITGDVEIAKGFEVPAVLI